MCIIKKGIQEAVNEELNTLLKKDYITESNSSWNNMIRPIIKPDKSVRLCMNLMALNEIVETDQHAIPKIEDILDALQGCKYFSVLDLKEGFFQILLKEEDCHKTAFTINKKNSVLKNPLNESRSRCAR